MYKIKFVLLIVILIASCKTKNKVQSNGIFEATEIIISAEATGRILKWEIEEGKSLKAQDLVGLIDCSQQELQIAQADATLLALPSKTTESQPAVNVLMKQKKSQESQLNVLNEQLKISEREKLRIQNLVKAEAAPAKQYDDIEGQVNILKRQIQVAESQLNVFDQQIAAQQIMVQLQNQAVLSEMKPMEIRKALVEDLKKRCSVTNPINGVVLSVYAHQFETAIPGKALYKIANLDTLVVRAYISEQQLNQLKIGQQIKVTVYQGDDQNKNYDGVLVWVSDKAEFTPKTIMTADERANLVYAIKIKVPNDGFLKIGMYADVNW